MTDLSAWAKCQGCDWTAGPVYGHDAVRDLLASANAHSAHDHPARDHKVYVEMPWRQELTSGFVKASGDV